VQAIREKGKTRIGGDWPVADLPHRAAFGVSIEESLLSQTFDANL
jgi:hypothetical protein